MGLPSPSFGSGRASELRSLAFVSGFGTGACVGAGVCAGAGMITSSMAGNGNGSSYFG